MELEIHPGAGFSNSTRSAMFKCLSKPNFDKIARSTAVLLIPRCRNMKGCQNIKSNNFIFFVNSFCDESARQI